MARDLIVIRPARREDADDLGPRLSVYDRFEAEETTGSATGALLKGVESSDAAWTVLLNGEIAVMWGWRTHDLVSGQARVWMLGSPVIRTRVKIFLRFSRAMIEMLLRRYTRLVAPCLLGYHASRRWLEWLGFHEYRRDGRWALYERRA